MNINFEVIDATFWITCASIFALLILSAFFSGSETALTAASRSKLRSKAQNGSRAAQRALNITQDNERLIGSVLLGNNLVNILAASLATALFTKFFGESGIALATLVMTLMVLVFAEVLPKTYAITNAETAAVRAAPVIMVIIRIFSPVVSAVRLFVRLILKLFGVKTDPDSHILAIREEIAGALYIGHSEGVVEKEDRDRILGALDLGDRTVEEIMLHRSQIEMININASSKEALEKCLNSSFSRLPVFDRDPENVIGVVHAKDILRELYKLLAATDAKSNELEQMEICKLFKKPYFVPETTMLDEQMQQFLRRRTHFALVVDEYGVLKGLITLEDILEEIVGDITDEFDKREKPALEIIDSEQVIADGSMTIRDLNRAMDWSLPDEEANTIAGLVIHEAQIIPEPNQVFNYHGFRFEVLGKNQNRITRLKVRKL